jgi:tyrosyl-tRNA synthetase
LSKFLDFDCGQTSAEIVNNYDWFKEFTFLGFLREAGKFLTVNYMMSKDSVQKRLETGISFTEFSYQLLPGDDFYWLYKNRGVRLQMGGSDQWGNITTGTEIIRRKENDDQSEAQGRAFALTTPLVTKADGTKFGKSESGNVWLDPAMTSPYQFYQFWINATDDDCPRLLRVFTLFTKAEIEAIEDTHAQAPHLRTMQKALAKDVTCRVHTEADFEMAVQASEILFGKGTLETLKSLDEQTFNAVFEGVPQSKISTSDFAQCSNLTDLISTATNAEIYPSKGEARKAILANALSINKLKLGDPAMPLDFELLCGKFLLIGKGKKNHLIVVE